MGVRGFVQPLPIGGLLTHLLRKWWCVCWRQAAPLQGRPGDSTGPSADMQRQLRLHKEPAQGPARCARPVSAFSLALESGLLALGLFRHLQN